MSNSNTSVAMRFSNNGLIFLMKARSRTYIVKDLSFEIVAFEEANDSFERFGEVDEGRKLEVREAVGVNRLP